MTLGPSFFFLKAGGKTPTWKEPSLYQQGSRHPYHQRQRIWGQEGNTNPCLTLPYLLVTVGPRFSTVSELERTLEQITFQTKGPLTVLLNHLLPSAQTPLSCQFFINISFLYLKGETLSALVISLGLHSLVNAPIYMQNFNKIWMHFLLSICLMSV